jgi:hypothetical protein
MYTDLLHEHAARSGTTEDFQKLVLEWVTHSIRPLRLLELTAVINSLPDRGGLSSDQDATLSIRTCCGPLLELCEDQVIQIIHHSFTEFLLNPDQHHVKMSSEGSVRFPVLDRALAHRRIAITCIKYLRSGCFDEWQLPHREGDESPRFERNDRLATYRKHNEYEKSQKELLLPFPFLGYASNWPLHAEKLISQDAELFEQLDEFMQDGNHDFESWKHFSDGRLADLPHEVSPLHVAVFSGLATYTKITA